MILFFIKKLLTYTEEIVMLFKKFMNLLEDFVFDFFRFILLMMMIIKNRKYIKIVYRYFKYHVNRIKNRNKDDK